MLRGKATLTLWFEPSHDYVGRAITEIIYGPVGLIRAGFSAVGLFLGRKSNISQEQNVKEFQFYIRMPNFRLLGSIIIKKYLKVADPLKGTDPLKINQIFHFLFFFYEKYTPFNPLSFGMTTITVGQREVRLAGVQRLRALSESRLSFVLTGVSFILFYLFYIFFFTFYYSTISYILNNKLP